MTTAEDIRSAFRARYPDVDDDEFSVEHSGFGHEHPTTAIGVVLISSVLLREQTLQAQVIVCVVCWFGRPLPTLDVLLGKRFRI